MCVCVCVTSSEAPEGCARLIYKKGYVTAAAISVCSWTYCMTLSRMMMCNRADSPTPTITYSRVVVVEGGTYPPIVEEY